MYPEYALTLARPVIHIQLVKFYLRDADANETLWNASYESMGTAQLLLSDLTTIGNKYPTTVEV